VFKLANHHSCLFARRPAWLIKGFQLKERGWSAPFSVPWLYSVLEAL